MERQNKTAEIHDLDSIIDTSKSNDIEIIGKCNQQKFNIDNVFNSIIGILGLRKNEIN